MAKDGSAEKMKRKDYEKKLEKLQVELCHLQEWVKAEKLKVIIIFEGRDAAGKGGTIKALTEKVSPRVFRICALPAPSDRQKSQLFIQRYIEQFPAGGEIVIFDRSWYNRAGVEYVMGFCTPAEHKRFLSLCPQMEKYVIEGGIILIKLWLEVGMDEQGLAQSENRRSAAAVEVESDGYRILPTMVRLLRSAGPDAEGNQHEAVAMVHRSLRRQASSSTELHRASAGVNS